MKEYFNNKNLLVLTLFTLLGLSVMNIIVRTFLLKRDTLLLPDYGEPFVTIILSLLLIIFAIKGKDRLFYIVCGGWLAYFVLSQIFGIPASVMSLLTVIQEGAVITSLAIVFRIAGMVGIIIIGSLLVRYMNKGKIHNNAFYLSTGLTMLVFLFCAVLSIFDMASNNSAAYLIVTILSLTHMTMVFLFVHFAYDSAKTQLSKTQL